MKKTTLIFTTAIPVSYDETRMTEAEALTATERVGVRRPWRARFDGRQLDTTGRYLDCRGPQRVE